MKKLLLESKGKFVIYVLACLFPVFRNLGQIAVISLIFEIVEQNSMPFFYRVLAIAILYLILDASLFVVSRMMRISFMRDILLSIRHKAFDKILSMSFKRFHQESRDVYVSNLINDVNTFENTFFGSLINLIFRAVMYVCTIAILAILNWPLALIIASVSVVVLIISKLFEKKTVALQKEVSTANEQFTVDAANVFAGLEILKLNNIEDTFLKQTNEHIARLEGKKYAFNVYTALQMNLNGTIGYFVLMGLLVFLMHQTQAGIGYGEIMLTTQLAASAIFPLVNLFPLVNTIQSSKAIYDKITASETSGETVTPHLPFVFERQIEVRQVSFAYHDAPVFKSIQFTLEKGKKYLLKGPSGSGKTTLFKLLSMMIDDYTGSIQVDGTEMKMVSPSSFHDHVAYVYQDVFLFEASLKDNITLFKPFSDDTVLRICEDAGLSEFVSSLPEGIHAPVTENGKNLSGGERQRVAIARALCKQAEILFVDEATASLNEALGRQIEETILSLHATVLSISHRHYEGVTNRYDAVLELKDGYLTVFPGADYFAEVPR